MASKIQCICICCGIINRINFHRSNAIQDRIIIKLEQSIQQLNTHISHILKSKWHELYHILKAAQSFKHDISSRYSIRNGSNHRISSQANLSSMVVSISMPMYNGFIENRDRKHLDSYIKIEQSEYTNSYHERGIDEVIYVRVMDSYLVSNFQKIKWQGV